MSTIKSLHLAPAFVLSLSCDHFLFLFHTSLFSTICALTHKSLCLNFTPLFTQDFRFSVHSFLVFVYCHSDRIIIYAQFLAQFFCFYNRLCTFANAPRWAWVEWHFLYAVYLGIIKIKLS